ncbi:MAG: hypothetical protein RMK84_20430, partial [Oscillochloridaceae bacterium]|nr:hypothetical protein [Chloroflexaceae bacterium]MDW8392484.1 hypothetical protein [Oscillochloridaceae bacterium]
PITLIFRYDGSRALVDGRVQYEIRYNNQTVTSPWLVTGDAASTFNNGPHGLRMFRLGGYMQINIDGDGNAPRRANAGIGGRVKWWNIKLTRNGVTKQVVGANRGDVNRDGCVDDADLLTVLFNFGTGCGN